MQWLSDDPKHPEEVFEVGFDLARQLLPGETLTGVTWAAEIHLGKDPNHASLLSGSGRVDASRVWVPLHGGQLGAVYRLRATVSTSQGRVLCPEGLLPMRDG